MNKILCFMFGHKWDHWIWADDRDYACNRCKRCGDIAWGCTVEHRQTYGETVTEDYKIIKRGA